MTTVLSAAATDPAHELKISLVTLLLAHPDNGAVAVTYNSPPEHLRTPRGIWFAGGTFQTDITDMRAGRKRRRFKGTIGYQVWAEDPGTVESLDAVTDAARQLLSTLDSVLADDPYAGIPNVLDWAVLRSGRLEHGWQDAGAAATFIGNIEYQSRPLDHYGDTP